MSRFNREDIVRNESFLLSSYLLKETPVSDRVVISVAEANCVTG